MHGKITLSFKREEYYLVIYQEDFDAPSDIIALLSTKDEAIKLCEVLAEEDDQPEENYLIIPINAYDNHEDYLNEEEVE